MTEAPVSPYRSMVYIDKESAIRAQMIGAIALIRQWRWWGAVIAGGALWSWAAGNPANDIDIFAHATRWSQWRARRKYGPSSLEREAMTPTWHTGYGGVVDGRGFHVYSTHLPNHSTEVDLVLSSKPRDKDRPSLAANLFDYGHCEVAFGLDWSTVDGASDYCAGTLNQKILKARDKNYVLSKVQQSLWKNPEARDKITDVMNKLAIIQGRTHLPYVPRLVGKRWFVADVK